MANTAAAITRIFISGLSVLAERRASGSGREVSSAA